MPPRPTAIQRSKRTQSGTLRRLQPTCGLPTGRVLKHYSAERVQHLRRLLSDPFECVYHPSFRRTRDVADLAVVVNRVAERRATAIRNKPGKRAGTLTAAEEQELFLAYNYARYRMMRLFDAHSKRRITAVATRELLGWDDIAHRICDEIINANLGLVPTMIERSRIIGVDFGELISEGQLALLRSVSKFDCGRGFKFSTYACRAIITSMARAVALMARHRSRFPAEYDPNLQRGDWIETRRAGVEEDYITELQSILRNNVGELTSAEQRVLNERFGLMVPNRRRTPAEQKTLRQVAETFGVTRERIRQIQNKALDKLRDVITDRVFAD